MGSCMLVRRAAVEEVGPLDESFFLFSEETDWCYRFREAGWQVWFFAGRGVRARRRRLARRPAVPRERARPPALPAKHRGARYAERARRLLRVSLLLRGRLVRGERGAAVPRGRRLARQRVGAGAARERMSDVLLLLRLALATAVVLAPGWAVARALGLRGVSATVAWSLALVFGALAVTFALGPSLTVTLVLLLAGGVVRRPVRDPRAKPAPRAFPAGGGSRRAGAVLGVLLWHVAGEVGGDGYFHLARVRKLLAFDELSLEGVGEFVDGGLHPGYAFPLWHGFLALVAKVAMVDPRDVVLHEASVLAPIAVLAAYEAGLALFRAVGPAAAAAAAQVALIALRARPRRRVHRPRAARHRLAPDPRAGRARARARGCRRAVARGARDDRRGGLRARSRPSDLRDLPLDPVRRLPRSPRWAWTRDDARRDRRGARGARRSRRALLRLAAAGRARHRLALAGRRARCAAAVAQYAGQLVVSDDGERYALAPELFGRGGAVAVAALAAGAARRAGGAAPVGGLRRRRLGGGAADRADAVALHAVQRPRLALAVAARGGLPAVRVRLRGRAGGRVGAAAALAAADRARGRASCCSCSIPATSTTCSRTAGRRSRPGPRRSGAWSRSSSGLRRRLSLERAAGRGGGAVPAAGLRARPVRTGRRTRRGGRTRSRPRCGEALRDGCPSGAVLFSDLESSYRAAAAAPVYIAAAPPGHVADTEENRPYAAARRRAPLLRHRRPRDPAAVRRRWLLIDRERFPRRLRPAGRLPRRPLHALPALSAGPQ